MPKLLFVVTEDWYFVSHRLALAREAQRAGFDVAVATRFGGHRQAIEHAGLRTTSFEMNRRGLNPLGLIWEALALANVLRRERPDIVHLVSLRPAVVGALAARIGHAPHIVFAVTGMGFLFTDNGRQTFLRSALQKVLPYLLSAGLTIVQNAYDAQQLVSFGLPSELLRLIPGSGVDIGRFVPVENENQVPVVMMASRLLWDKGVGEFVSAARILHGEGARFVLVGALDTDNPTSIPEDVLKRWVEEGVVEWWGHVEDMTKTLVFADIFCLPSYREGLPKALLEAMACGKPCVTTDVPGCRDAVQDGDNGLLVPAKDATALAAAIARLLHDPDLRCWMGKRGRQRAVEEFNHEKVIAATLAIYRDTLA